MNREITFVLMSIKPIYAKKILDGSKWVEFRRVPYKSKDINGVFIYETKPVGMVTGEFYVRRILHEPLELLWEHTERWAGISKDEFMQYFHDCETGYALPTSTVKKYDKPIPISEFGVKPPQNFVYIRRNLEDLDIVTKRLLGMIRFSEPICPGIELRSLRGTHADIL